MERHTQKAHDRLGVRKTIKIRIYSIYSTGKRRINRRGIRAIKSRKHEPTQRNAIRRCIALGFDLTMERHTQKAHRKGTPFVCGSPMGNRTPVSAVRGRRLNRLTMRPNLFQLEYITISAKF